MSDDLRAFVRAFLRERPSTSAFLRRAAGRTLPQLAPQLTRIADPLRHPETLDALVAAFKRGGAVDPERLDQLIQQLSQDAQPALTARYERDLPLESLAWRFRTTVDVVLGALGRIRRHLLKGLGKPLPPPGLDDLIQKHLESALSSDEAETLASKIVRYPSAADAFADAARLDAELSAYFMPEEEKTTSPRSSPARRRDPARSRI